MGVDGWQCFPITGRVGGMGDRLKRAKKKRKKERNKGGSLGFGERERGRGGREGICGGSSREEARGYLEEGDRKASDKGI
jgi:hypothetical protein